jgi:hypothetical protein
VEASEPSPSHPKIDCMTTRGRSAGGPRPQVRGPLARPSAVRQTPTMLRAALRHNTPRVRRLFDEEDSAFLVLDSELQEFGRVGALYLTLPR